jgi:hypothetical protein
MVLFSQGISFFIQSLLLPTIGALADYGNHGPKILLWITLVSCAAQIGFLGFNNEGCKCSHSLTGPKFDKMIGILNLLT